MPGRANAIASGYFVTDMTQPLTEDTQFDAWAKGNVRLGRWGNPSELVGPVILLASRAASYITGRVIAIEGS